MARTKSTTTAKSKATAPTATQPAPAEEQVTLTGRLTRDPELRTTKSGKSVSTIRIAVNAPEADTTYHSVVVWNRTAEVICQFLKKGRMVEVIGRPQERTWSDQDGNEHRATEISAYRVQFLPSERTAPATAQEVA